VQKGYTLEVISDESAVVKMIFELYTIGEEQPDNSLKRLGSTLIANKLNKMKIPSATGIDWRPSQILELMRNPVYIGKVRWNNRPEVKNALLDEVIAKAIYTKTKRVGKNKNFELIVYPRIPK